MVPALVRPAPGWARVLLAYMIETTAAITGPRRSFSTSQRTPRRCGDPCGAEHSRAGEGRPRAAFTTTSRSATTSARERTATADSGGV
jgi:hypothetical protein